MLGRLELRNGVLRSAGAVPCTGPGGYSIGGVLMTAVTQTDSDFAFAGLDTPAVPLREAAAAQAGVTPDPLGALAALAGTWIGHGFNAIWRPHHPANPQDRFLELNLTDETLVATPINGPSPH